MASRAVVFFLFVTVGCAAPGGVDPVAMSAARPGWNLDSPVFFHQGRHAFAAVTCKNFHRIVMFDPLNPVTPGFIGTKGNSPGRFLRPNGIARIKTPGFPGSALIVVERDNVRLQIVSGQPGGRSLAILRSPLLRRPYGIAVHQRNVQTFLYITDYLPDRLGNRVHCFRLYFPEENTGGGYMLDHVCSFGKAREGLKIPESVVVDPEFGRVILCDETPGKGMLLVYNLKGRFLFTRGTGRFLMDPEGIALVSFLQKDLYADLEGIRIDRKRFLEAGFLLAADQMPVTRIRLFYRRSLRYAGSTCLNATSHTDGIAVGNVNGRTMLAAVHGDTALHFYSVRDIIRARRR